MWKGSIRFKKYLSIFLSLGMLSTLYPMYTPAIAYENKDIEYEIASDSNASNILEDGIKESVNEENLVSTPSNTNMKEDLNSDAKEKLDNEKEIFNDEELNISNATPSNANKLNLINQTLVYESISVTGLLPDGALLDINYLDKKLIEDSFDSIGFVDAFNVNIIYNDDIYEFEDSLLLSYTINNNFEYIDVYLLDQNYIEISWDEAVIDENKIQFEINSNGIYLLNDPLAVLNSYQAVTLVDEDYIYFDLNAGNVSINDSTYSGYVYIDGVKTVVSGDHSDSNEYYIYQSNEDNLSTTGLVNDKYILPSYDGLVYNNEPWGDYITDNTSINDIITNWVTSAEKVGRTSTPNNITVSGNLDCTIIIDNVWSSFQTVSEGRITGGITMKNSGDTDLTVKLLGDNRLGNIYYCSSVDTNSLTITDFDGDKESNNTLTLGNFVVNSGNSHYNSLIGASDNTDHSVGIIINGGIIWGGTTTKDNCTVIGGGGNGKGVVTINGGTITAVANSSGTAIGGGIGYSSYGGDAIVTITDGKVYAYNFGYYVSGEIIPAVAIGGGSSRASTGNKSTTVNISGGDIYAYCVGGTAIGGGGSTTKDGGPATINITGGNITAISASNEDTGVEAGCSIGGGTGGTGGNGGDVTLNISGNTVLKTGSVGGGKTNNPNGYIGSATVDISGGSINGQFIMASGSKDDCSFIMTDGIIDNSNNIYTFLESNGGAVYIEGGTATIEDGKITGCSAVNGGAIYIVGGDFNMSGGDIYNNISSEYGGAVFVNGGNIEITGGFIDDNESEKSGGGIYVTSNSNDFTVDIYSGSITNNYSGENGGGIGIDVDSNSNVMINIGSELCKGLNELHSHPIIKNNTAFNQGGGFYLNGDESNITLNMYCGNIDNNFANYERSSDNVSQTGGLFTWYGGEIGQGLCVTGGTLLDEKVNSQDIDYDITYYSNYPGDNVINESKLAVITDGVEICLPAFAFTKDGYYLIGWSEKAVPESNKDIISIGANYEVIGDKTLYAIWSDVSPSISYMVYIPDKIEIDDTKKATLELSVEMSYFPYNSYLTLIVNRDDVLSLDSNNSIGLHYNLFDNDKIINNGDIITTWSLRNRDSKKLTLELLDEAKYSGNYSDILTFTLDYSDELEEEDL